MHHCNRMEQRALSPLPTSRHFSLTGQQGRKIDETMNPKPGTAKAPPPHLPFRDYTYMCSLRKKSDIWCVHCVLRALPPPAAF